MASPDWSSLPPEMVGCVGEKLLATNDIDAYMDMRAVCPSWRSAIARPTPLGGGDDLRFRPRQWIMLEDDASSKADGDDARLFLHVSTGRFLRRRLPLLRDDDTHILVGACAFDGLLILSDTKGRRHAAALLNPFTGDMLRLAEPIPLHGKKVLLGPGDLRLVYLWRGIKVDDPDIVPLANKSVKLFKYFLLQGGPLASSSSIAHGGHIYLLVEELLYKSDGEFRNSCGTLCAAGASEVILAPAQGPDDWPKTDDSFLVESAEDLLLVYRLKRLFRVFRVDGGLNVMQPVRSLGGRALFLGRRCLSVDANELPAVHGDCIYHCTADNGAVYKFNIVDGMVETLLKPHSQISVPVRPLCLVQVLLAHCSVLPDVEA